MREGLSWGDNTPTHSTIEDLENRLSAGAVRGTGSSPRPPHEGLSHIREIFSPHHETFGAAGHYCPMATMQ